MADQKITLKIANKTYSLTASSPEKEQKMRLAAESINKKLEVYNQKFASQPLEDKLVFVTLMEIIDKLTMKDRVNELAAALKELQDETDAYLANNEKE